MHWDIHCTFLSSMFWWSEGFLLMFNSNIGPNSAPLWDTRFQNVSDLDIHLSRPLNVKCNHTNGLPIYAFLLMFNSNIGPNSAPLQDTKLQNLSDLDFDLSRSNVMVSLDSPYMVSNWYITNNCVMSISHCLAVIATQNVSPTSYLLSLGPNYEKLKAHRMTSKLPWTL